MTEGVFGNNPPDPKKQQGAGYGDNPLGLPRKEEPAPDQGHPEQPQQQEPPAQAPERKEQGHPEPTPQDTQQTRQDQPPEDKEKPVLGKYKDHRELQQALVNIGQKLGKDVNWEAMYKEGTDQVDLEKLEAAYKQAEQQLGQTSDIDQTRSKLSQIEQENEKLKQLNKTYQAYMTRLMAQRQQPYPGQPPQAPQYAQQPTQQQQAPQQPEPQQKEDSYDTDQFFEDFYKKGPEAIQKIVESSIKKYQQPQQPQQPPTQQNFGQYQQPQQPQQQPQPQVDYHRQVADLKAKYGQEFEEMKEDVGKVIQDPKNSYLLSLPDGMERAYNKAKLNKRRSQREQLKQQAQHQQMEVFKNAAQIGPGQARTGERPMTREEWEKKQIFQPPEKKGFFG